MSEELSDARLKPTIWQSHLAQRLIDKKGWALLISTPRGKGWFYDLFRRGRGGDADFESWNNASWTNPHLDASVIEEERNRLPERVFHQEFGGEFLEGGGAVFRNVRECAVGEWQEPCRDEQYYAGLDLAKVEDYTVLVVMDMDRRVVFADRFNRVDWSVQVDRVGAATQRYNCARVYVDVTGAGDPVFENLRKVGIRAASYPFTAKSKAALINQLAIAFEERRIVIPKPELWPEGVDELESFVDCHLFEADSAFNETEPRTAGSTPTSPDLHPGRGISHDLLDKTRRVPVTPRPNSTLVHGACLSMMVAWPETLVPNRSMTTA